MGRVAWRRHWRVALLLLGCRPCDGWPHYLLIDGCAKGLEILDSGGPPPIIMGAVTVVDPSILSVSVGYTPAGSSCSASQGGILGEGASVDLGVAHTLMHNASSGHGFQTVFVVSSGSLEGGEPCGQGEAQLLCTTCGDQDAPGWIKRATWTPTRPGVTTLAVGAASIGFGTPAVTIATLTVNVSASPLGPARPHAQQESELDARTDASRWTWWPWRRLGG